MIRPCIFLAGLLAATVSPLVSAEKAADDVGPDTPVRSETRPERTLRQIVERQKALLAEAGKQGDQLDQESFRVQMQSICHEYELLIHDSPDFAAAYAAYGYLLGNLDMHREAIAILLKANQLDPTIPLVKNQLGDYLAEEGKPLEAINYFLAAIKLDPGEPLYHYQVGTLLYEARDEFIKKGVYTRQTVSAASHAEFGKAAELAPDRIEFTYRYAESFYDLETPDWQGALKAWSELEAKAQSPLERDTMRLHEANIFIKLGQFDRARAIIDAVPEPELDQQKQKLIAQLPASPAK